jgi:hypothetical protein
MKIRFALLTVALFGFALSSCNKPAAAASGPETAATQADPSQADPAAAASQSGPAAVVAQLFTAAKKDDPKLLGGLCDPQKENDGDTDCLCALDPSYVPHKCDSDSGNRIPWVEFKMMFQDGKVNGKARIEGDHAEVDFTFGEGGSESETMALVKRNGNWYFESF